MLRTQCRVDTEFLSPTEGDSGYLYHTDVEDTRTTLCYPVQVHLYVASETPDGQTPR